MIVLYYHGGSANHGCEAIVRSTQCILSQPLTLFSSAADEDILYHLDRIVTVCEDTYVPVREDSPRYLISAACRKLHQSDFKFIEFGHKSFFSAIHKGDICLSIGGDNYCYAGTDKLGYYNIILHRKGAKTVLWGCSIEPSVLTPNVIKDLKRYDLITVRENLSYESLRQAGISDNVVLCADPAFQLEKAECTLPEGFSADMTIGINVSPLAASCGNKVMENYIELVRYILNETDYRVMLIPHVVKQGTDDRETLRQIYDAFADTGRISLVPDKNCMELKGLISQCRMFIGARTHATIAAYSTCVPTLAVGYSIKARGIAKDIFGKEDGFVVSVQNLKSENDLTDAFRWLQVREGEIKLHLKNTIPEYSKKSFLAGDALRKLVKRP
ncbi:MAG: polysaccharide pyruvyl transferase family protein [Eubacteriales bacterium]|nr:polysaccharide pyruvyl transferase family protein [Eubacteriales bacterium]